MKLGSLVNGKEALAKLNNQSLPINIGWDLQLLSKKIVMELNAYEDIRFQKVKELGDEIEPGKFSVKKENEQIFFKWLDEILAKEVDVKVKQIKISELLAYRDHNGKPITMSANELSLLDWLIIE